MRTTIAAAAAANLEALRANPYPGRGFVVGTETQGTHVVQVYWLMGRSATSRNRRLVCANDTVSIEAVDTSLAVDPLAHYHPMRERLFNYIVSNGDQTDTIISGNSTDCFELATRVRGFEPDTPNYTSRISAMSSVHKNSVVTRMSVVSRSQWGECERALYYMEKQLPGYGHCLHTYAGDGNPIPAFAGRPFPLPLKGVIEEIAAFYWDALNADNRVALVAKLISIDSGTSKVHIINRF